MSPKTKPTLTSNGPRIFSPSSWSLNKKWRKNMTDFRSQNLLGPFSTKYKRLSRNTSILPTLWQITRRMPIYETESNPMATFNPKLFLAQEPKTQANTQILSFHLIPNMKKSDPHTHTHTSQLLDEAPLADFFFSSSSSSFRTNLQPIPVEEANLKQI